MLTLYVTYIGDGGRMMTSEGTIAEVAAIVMGNGVAWIMKEDGDHHEMVRKYILILSI